MLYTWFFFVLILAILLIVGWALLRFKLDKPRKDKTLSLLAHTDSIAALPEYKRAERKYYRLLRLALALFVVTIGSVTALAARPISVSEESEDYETRDIMICADVSGSMQEVDEEAFSYLQKVVAGLKGQRVGVTLFDGAPIMFAPLSNDYLAISETLESIKTNLSEYESLVWQASHSSSQIGSSAIGCINNFDKLEVENRSRALILVTDNQTSDKISLSQAAEYGARYGVAFYNIDVYTKDIDLLTNKLSAGNDSSVGPEYEMYKVGNSTGGNYYIVCANKSSENCTREDNTVSKIVDDVMKQEAIRTKGAPKLIKSDAPQIVAIVTLVAFSALMLVIWRVKL